MSSTQTRMDVRTESWRSSLVEGAWGGLAAMLLAAAFVTMLSACRATDAVDSGGPAAFGGPINPALAAQGQQIFRYDDYGDTAFWTGTLRLNEVVQGLTPVRALGLGLKVDVDAIPPAVLQSVLSNPSALSDPATTRALLGLNAVVGVTAKVSGDKVTSLGVTCALCHSTVDNSVTAGIGHRLDGWPNRDLKVGSIVAAAPGLPDGAVKNYLLTWKPGFYDARVNEDGRMDGPTTIPPAYGLHDVPLETYTGEGPVSYWNAYVAVTQMHGQGAFSDPRLGIHVAPHGADLVTPKLVPLREYQFSLAVPHGTASDPAAATRGQAVFNGPARCSACHTGPTYTDAPTLHSPSEIPTEPTWAARSTTKMYRTTPLRGLQSHPPYFHDGSASSLNDVVERYDTFMHLGLSGQQKSDLVEYLKTL